MKVLQNLVKELNKTVVIVMHDINFASCYSDNIVVMKSGKVVRASEKECVINKEFLEEIYEIDFDIRDIGGNKICIYHCNNKCKKCNKNECLA